MPIRLVSEVKGKVWSISYPSVVPSGPVQCIISIIGIKQPLQITCPSQCLSVPYVHVTVAPWAPFTRRSTCSIPITLSIHLCIRPWRSGPCILSLARFGRPFFAFLAEFCSLFQWQYYTNLRAWFALVSYWWAWGQPSRPTPQGQPRLGWMPGSSPPQHPTKY